jgi:tartrate dehydrogenase/decarboxylase/D-malate dehydrogenase
MMPADGLDALRGKDAILFGSAGDPTSPTTSRCGACA